ncbi:transcriptional regulator, LysR family [Deinococcus phoenicis]|uniref:Transcriptional regulator, LysR family n=1 Tax=Deinococcus phoenicis TaxID=1476583 RepID=A0A016QLQ8_9DEIO|nr:LysR substrate-binding domain-containing protein [Deinococcus phoenicis]EYB66827.1 transcriptional regulator, LysR family [Deinococcus phoenicis]
MTLHAEPLLTFAAVARTGSLTAAARERHLSQPSVSTQLKRLADAVGEPLFFRHRQGVRLTPAGEALLPHAQALQRALGGARQLAHDLQDLQHGTLRVVASNTLAAQVLPRALAAFHARHPGVTLDIQTGNTREAVRALREGQADLALIEGPGQPFPGGVQATVIGYDTLRLILSPQHPLARPHLGAGDLQHLKVIWREAGSGTREVAEQVLQQAGITVQPVLELAGTEAIKEAVLSGLGAAFVSELSVRRERAAGHLASPDLSLPGLERALTALTPEVPSRTARALLGDLLAVQGLERVSSGRGKKEAAGS